MHALLATFLLGAETDVAEEGKNIITMMLLTGLVFVAVILLGQLARYLGHRRAHRRAARRAY
jgi:hypothetical protein